MKKNCLIWENAFKSILKNSYLMNKTLKYFGLLAILPLLTVAITINYAPEADALKGQGVSAARYGSATSKIVCGDRLCSEVPGGYEAWKEGQGESSRTTVPTAPAPEMEAMDSMEKEMELTDSMEVKEMDSMEEEKADPGSVLRLSRANVPAVIPLHQGFYDGGDVYFIITDASDEAHANTISENQGWRVDLAQLLANAPDAALSITYMFKNGVEGDGVHGYQGEIFTSTPAQSDVYSALTSHVHVEWNDGSEPQVLMSEQEVMDAESAGDVTLDPLDVVVNMPQIMWPDGHMMVKEDKTLTDETGYGGGQVLDINTDEMTVTFIAHRGWGPDGRTIYYIVTDATPSGPAGMMGVTNAPTSANLIANSAAVDLFQFKNGIKGSGPLGFQAGIAAGAPGDANYSPMLMISFITCEDPDNASLIVTMYDIFAYQKAGLVDTTLLRPMNSDHIVNCPFIDPFQ